MHVSLQIQAVINIYNQAVHLRIQAIILQKGMEAKRTALCCHVTLRIQAIIFQNQAIKEKKIVPGCTLI